MQDTSRIIVVGASAGGVAALLRVVPHLSPTIAAPILLVLHIGAHRSQLAELLDARGPLHAVTAEHGALPQPGTIHIAPPDLHLTLEGGRMQLHYGPKEHHARPAINPLFRSAALDRGPRVVGVVMTGAMDDGTEGLQAIKACGGTTVVQDPDDAAEPAMPRSALANVDVDHVLRLDAIAGALNALSRPLESLPRLETPQWLPAEHAISLAAPEAQRLATSGAVPGLMCPRCGGVLLETDEAYPAGVLCHTGHAFGAAHSP